MQWLQTWPLPRFSLVISYRKHWFYCTLVNLYEMFGRVKKDRKRKEKGKRRNSASTRICNSYLFDLRPLDLTQLLQGFCCFPARFNFWLNQLLDSAPYSLPVGNYSSRNTQQLSNNSEQKNPDSNIQNVNLPDKLYIIMGPWFSQHHGKNLYLVTWPWHTKCSRKMKDQLWLIA